MQRFCGRRADTFELVFWLRCRGATVNTERRAAAVTVGKTVILLHPPLHSVGVSGMGMKRGGAAK